MALSSERTYRRWGAPWPVSDAHVVSSTIFCLKAAWQAVHVRQIVTGMGGAVDFESVPGRTVFTVRLPFVD